MRGLAKAVHSRERVVLVVVLVRQAVQLAVGEKWESWDSHQCRMPCRKAKAPNSQKHCGKGVA